MSSVRVCDRHPEGANSIGENAEFVPITIHGADKETHIDLCSQCIQDFNGFMNQLRQTAVPANQLGGSQPEPQPDAVTVAVNPPAVPAEEPNQVVSQ